MNKTTEKILKTVSGFKGKFEGAYNIREDGQCAGRQSSKNIKIESKEDGPGLIIHKYKDRIKRRRSWTNNSYQTKH